jgi:hypothetical protein
VIRALLGAAFGAFISRFFFKQISVVSVVGLAIFLVGLAYLLEYFRNRKTKE